MLWLGGKKVPKGNRSNFYSSVVVHYGAQADLCLFATTAFWHLFPPSHSSPGTWLTTKV